MTENLFGEMAKAGEGFDKFDPRNVAQLVTFLATDEAADISGQNFVVYGGDIWAMGGFHAVGEIHRESMWTPASWPRPRASCSRTSPRASHRSASSRPKLTNGWRVTAAACPTTFSSPSALRRRTSRSTRCSPPSSRVPVTTIFVSSFSAGQVCLAKRT